ncbi:MAG TPA: hypothetical protein VHD83_11345, partial [Puia sp.]|nr:hypothetical protein [Puia sp.]
RGLVAHIPDMAHTVKDIIHLGIPGLCFMVVSAAGLFIAYRKGMLTGMFYDNMLLYLVALLVSLTGWILYKRLYPLERGLCFVVPAINLVFVNGCYDLFRRWFVRRSNVLLALILLMAVKIGGSVRGLYWERFDLEHDVDVRLIRVLEKDVKALDEFHPASWQITTSDDFYPMYVQEYLIRKGRGREALFSRTAVEGDVIFVPDGPKMPLSLDELEKKYVLWADDKPTSYGRRMRIYVSRGLVDTCRD